MPVERLVQAYRFGLDPTTAQQRSLAAHVGAGRVAFNAMLAEVKSTLEAREWERRLLGGCVTDAQGWSLPALRRTWNAHKDEWAPWWRECSKEAFNTGLSALASALDNWATSRSGARAGPVMGFPRFRRKGRGPQSVRFTTGALRIERDRHHVVLPRLGRVRTHESTRKLARRLEAGTARILSAVVTRTARRWWVSFTVETERSVGVDGRPGHVGRSTSAIVGVDVGVRTLATVADDAGRVVDVVSHPKAFNAVRGRLRGLQRRAARQQRGSKRWRLTEQQIARCHQRAAHVRRDTLNKLTSRLAQEHDVVVIEDLNVAGMGRRKRGLGARGRGFNRALRDAAIGEIGRQLAYKCHWYGSRLVVADRWYPSSKTCSTCGRRKPSLPLAERTYHCQHCGVAIDRDVNAAVNLARHSGHDDIAGSGPVTGRRANPKTKPRLAGGNEASTPRQQPLDQTGTVPSQEETAA